MHHRILELELVYPLCLCEPEVHKLCINRLFSFIYSDPQRFKVLSAHIIGSELCCGGQSQEYASHLWFLAESNYESIDFI